VLSVIVVAAGRGSRMGSSVNKLMLPLCGKPVLWRCLQRLSCETAIDEIVLVAHPQDIPFWNELGLHQHFRLLKAIVPGGETRTASVRAGLAAVSPQAEWIAIHDGARPLVSSEDMRLLWESRSSSSAAILVLPVNETIKRSAVDSPYICETVNRQNLWTAQTPQLFTRELIEAAYASSDAVEISDDAALVEALAARVVLVKGSKFNIKITNPEDLQLAETLWQMQEVESIMVRTGMGYDMHRLEEGRKLVLCGVEVPCDRGLPGHSDADVAVHALCDALLGALALGDIGQHFPENDPQYKGICSLILLERCRSLVGEKGYSIGNVDITIIAEAPRLSPYRQAMREKIAQTLDCSIEQISLKATTTEGLDATGRCEGIAAQAIVLLRLSKPQC